MPRRPNTASAEELHARLGPGAEIADWLIDGAQRVRVHRGWRWSCSCAAFVRTAQRYLWVPCHRHDTDS